MPPITVTTTRPAHIAALVVHQQICFPTLDPDERFQTHHFAAQLQVFPAGQHVALDGDRVVAQSSTFRCRADQAFSPHTFHEIIGAGYFSNHDPQGEWLYGADMSVHPDYRRRGIAHQLYNVRKTLINDLGLRGMVSAGMLPGYRHYRDQMSSEAYLAEVVAGRINDPTLTPQLHNGFSARGVLHNYLHGGELGNESVLIVWEAGSGKR